MMNTDDAQSGGEKRILYRGKWSFGVVTDFLLKREPFVESLVKLVKGD